MYIFLEFNTCVNAARYDYHSMLIIVPPPKSYHISKPYEHPIHQKAKLYNLTYPIRLFAMALSSIINLGEKTL